MSQQLLDAIVAIATLAIPIILAAVLPLVRQYLQAKIAAVQHDELKKWITTLVTSAEQQFGGIGKDEAKLDYVTEQARLYIQSIGLTLTREQVRALIESAVRAMSTPLPATSTVTVAVTTPAVPEVTAGQPIATTGDTGYLPIITGNFGGTP